jgi:hypothetical protein
MAEHPNQELVRRGFQAFNEGDMMTLTELIADDAVQVMAGDNMFSGEHKGRDAILGMYAELFQETGGTFRAELQGVHANDQMAVAIYRGTGTRGTKVIDQLNALVFEIVDGLAVRLTDLAEDITAWDEFLA